MLSLLISLLILCLILGVVYWIITMIPVPPPMTWVVRKHGREFGILLYDQ